jgi:NAD-dependent DNA ligase
MTKDAERIEALRETIHRHNYLYTSRIAPRSRTPSTTASCASFRKLEEAHPELVTPG